MITTNSTQIKINIPVKLKDMASGQAKKYGFTLASYIRHLLLEKLETAERGYNPEFVKKVLKASKNKKNSIDISNIDEYFAKIK